MTIDRWNPNDPTRIGLEWGATSRVARPVDWAQEYATRFMAPETATVNRAHWFGLGPEATAGQFQDAGFNSIVLATVYEQGREGQSGWDQTHTIPGHVSGDSATDGMITGAASVEDALFAFDTSSGVILTVDQEVEFGFYFPRLLQDIFAQERPRILSVTINTLWRGDGPGGDQRRVSGRIGLPGARRPLGTHIVQPGPAQMKSIETGEVRPWYSPIDTVERRVWLLEDLEDIESGTVRVHFNNSTGGILGQDPVTIFGASMTITWAIENRVAVGGRIYSALTIHPPWEPETWQGPITIQNANTGNNGVTLIAGRDYLWTITRATPLSFTDQVIEAHLTSVHAQKGQPREMGALQSQSFCMAGKIDCADLTRNQLGLIVSDPTPVDRGYSMVLQKSDDDFMQFASNPYGSITLTTGGTEPGTIGQTITSSHDCDYDRVTFLTRVIGQPADLEITIHEGYVGGAVLASASISRVEWEELDVNDDGFACVTLMLDTPVSVVADTVYRIELTGLHGNDRWQVPGLTVGIADAAIEDELYDATYGGEDLRLGGNLGTDWSATLSTLAPAVTGLTLGEGTQDLAPVIEPCPPGFERYATLDYINICWDDVPTTECGTDPDTGFCAWELQRFDDPRLGWQTIAVINDKGFRCFADYEGRIGVELQYRVRQCRDDGVCSDWSDVVTTTREGPRLRDGSAGGCVGLIFVSNESPTQTLAYPYAFLNDNAEGEIFQFLESETVALHKLHMRDYHVAFRPLERGGVRFQRLVLVNAISVPTERLDDGFRSLRDLAWDSLSYVAVLDTRGRRWFAAVIVPEGSVIDSKQIYLAAVDIVEVTDLPSAASVGAL